eukprot:s108_g29.t1
MALLPLVSYCFLLLLEQPLFTWIYLLAIADRSVQLPLRFTRNRKRNRNPHLHHFCCDADVDCANGFTNASLAFLQGERELQDEEGVTRKQNQSLQSLLRWLAERGLSVISNSTTQ